MSSSFSIFHRAWSSTYKMPHPSPSPSFRIPTELIPARNLCLWVLKHTTCFSSQSTSQADVNHSIWCGWFRPPYFITFSSDLWRFQVTGCEWVVWIYGHLCSAYSFPLPSLVISILTSPGQYLCMPYTVGPVTVCGRPYVRICRHRSILFPTAS